MYDVYVSRSYKDPNNEADYVRVAKDLEIDQYTVQKDLMDRRTHHWYVVAKDGKGGEIKSDKRKFKTKMVCKDFTYEGRTYPVEMYDGECWMMSNIGVAFGNTRTNATDKTYSFKFSVIKAEDITKSVVGGVYKLSDAKLIINQVQRYCPSIVYKLSDAKLIINDMRKKGLRFKLPTKSQIRKFGLDKKNIMKKGGGYGTRRKIFYGRRNLFCSAG